MVRPWKLVVLAYVVIVAGPRFALADDSLHTLLTIVGDSPGQHLGRAISGGGDINGDGFADLVVGDPSRKECRVYLGAPSLSSSPSLVIAQPETCPGFPPSTYGGVVSGARDINGDGYDDLVVTNAEWLYVTGKAYVYYGGAEVDTIPDVAIAGYGSSWLHEFWSTDLRGRVVGDINGDGYDELACLAYYTVDTGAYVYFGGAPMDSVHDVGCRGPGYPYLELGSDIASGDLNGDGFGDLVVGAYGAENHPEVQDAAWVYFGGTEVDETPDVILSPSRVARDNTVLVPGDLNGDGFEDVVVGPSRYTNPTVTDPGCAHVYFGSARMDSVADLALVGDIDGGCLALAGGDINGDGYADLIVCERPVWHPPYTVGRLSVYLGGADMDSIPAVVITGSGRFGETVTWIGDMNGDGWPEFAVSDPDAAGGPGEIYIYTLAQVGSPPHPLPLPDPVALTVAPNPGAGPFHISWSSAAVNPGAVEIVDINGRVVRSLRAGSGGAIVWDGCNGAGIPVPSGVYVVRMQEGGVAHSRKVVVVR
ncbi:FG-GAP repeat protein [Candidatus Fermentibacteria bacterium]|nr:FG-GAP repeat protein [Candidatus Fermentibacteria bacterium]